MGVTALEFVTRCLKTWRSGRVCGAKRMVPAAAPEYGEDITGALYGAGYGSSRGLYKRADESLGMTPGAYRKGGRGMTICFTVFETGLGSCLVAATEKRCLCTPLRQG